jgi:DNA-directed RNA polymerase subunit H (RpoH/RPB5)
MVKEDKKKSIEIIEQGDIFFFYRPKVDTEEVKDIKDVQRFYMVTTPEEEKNDIYRLFLIGQKQLPEIVEGKSTSEEKNWALNILTTSNPDDIHKELLPAEYTTETRGKRRLSAAAPAGEGKYKIVKHDSHTELAYILELPEIPGPTQREFEIKKEASYIISVKNPEVNIPGFATVSEKKPEYPKHIKEKFGNRRWISIEDPQLLNYENTQVLLIGARKKDVEEELGIDIDEQKETENTADIFKELKVRKEQVPLKPLMKGKFPGKEEEVPMAQEVKHLSKEEYPGGKGGKVGGKVAATASPSAAAVAKLLSGIKFPKDKNKLVDYAKENKSKVKSSDEIIELIKELPDRKYHSMADIEKALGEIR